MVLNNHKNSSVIVIAFKCASLCEKGGKMDWMHFQMFVSLGEFWNIGNWEIRKYFLEQEKWDWTRNKWGDFRRKVALKRYANDDWDLTNKVWFNKKNIWLSQKLDFWALKDLSRAQADWQCVAMESDMVSLCLLQLSLSFGPCSYRWFMVIYPSVNETWQWEILEPNGGCNGKIIHK